MPDTDNAPWTDRLLVSVDRAIGDIRRGLPAVIQHDDGTAILAASAETLPPTALRAFREFGLPEPVLALTAGRAAALNIRPTGHSVLLISLPARMSETDLRELVDATTDLSQPLRGPWSRLLRAPTALESAAVTLSKLARLLPAAILSPIPPEKTRDFAGKNGFLALNASAISAYEQHAARKLTMVAQAAVPLADAERSRLIAFRPTDGGIEHMAVIVGRPPSDAPVLVRLHSECFTGDLIASLKCDCGEQLRGAIQDMQKNGSGILLYLAQEGRGIGLMNKLRAYRLQEDGFDTVDANLKLGFDADERIFTPAAQMLALLGVGQVRLMTNNPDKVEGLRALGIDVVERVAHRFPANQHNEAYLRSKKDKAGHYF